MNYEEAVRVFMACARRQGPGDPMIPNRSISEEWNGRWYLANVNGYLATVLEDGGVVCEFPTGTDLEDISSEDIDKLDKREDALVQRNTTFEGEGWCLMIREEHGEGETNYCNRVFETEGEAWKYLFNHEVDPKKEIQGPYRCKLGESANDSGKIWIESYGETGCKPSIELS